MYKAKAYVASSATTPLGPAAIERREPTDHDVQIEILFCGICHSDLHQARDEWHDMMPTVYPCVPGHEIVGRVTKVGSLVTKFKPGDLAAVGCMVDSDRTCPECKAVYVCDGSNFLLTSVDLPVVSQVITATEKEPILCILLKLEMAAIREILSQHEFHLRDESADARGMAVGITSAELLDACARLISLLDTPEDMPFLAPLLQREIIYRLLRSPQGKHLRGIATLGEQGQRTSKAVEWLRMNYAKPLRVEELAAMARMGVSTLHHQFRSLTAMSPLQYQKQLRLHVARERMLNDGIDAASAAFEVGYESASQFSREYSRFFGQPPMRDVKASRLSGTVSARD